MKPPNKAVQWTTEITDKTVTTTEKNQNSLTNKAININNNQPESERPYMVFHRMPNMPDQNQSQSHPSVQLESMKTPFMSKKKESCMSHKFNMGGVINNSKVKHEVKREKDKTNTFNKSEDR